jgi:hypothetical protein
MEVCRIGTDEGFEERNLSQPSRLKNNVRYKLRIVCPEGAIVRDGTEIDDCASVGSMEMGEIVEAYDRCINSSGVLRYHTNRGWVSEHTRGHGREPISEVLAVLSVECIEASPPVERHQTRIESGVPDISFSAASVLARLQLCHSEIYTTLTRLEMQNIRSLSTRSISFQEETIGYHISAMMNLLQTQISRGLGRPKVLASFGPSSGDSSADKVSKSGIALYLGSMLNLLQSCLFEDKRDKRTVNLPLLIRLVGTSVKASTGKSLEKSDPKSSGIFDAVEFIFELGLADLQIRFSASRQMTGHETTILRLSRYRIVFANGSLVSQTNVVSGQRHVFTFCFGAWENDSRRSSCSSR